MNIYIILFVVVLIIISFISTSRQTPEERKRKNQMKGMNSSWDGWYDSDSNDDCDGDD